MMTVRILTPAEADPVTVPAPADPACYRKAVAMFATGVAVVTAVDGNGEIHGATVNSFTSISLRPPTVMVSLLPGLAHSLISRSGWYGVSVLSSAQRVHSSHYGGRYEIEWEPDFVAGHRVATLKDSLAWFECQVINEFQVHDHTLFVAHVVACDSAKPGEGEPVSPLMFFSSSDRFRLRGDS
jgi:flavin reductase (DIM6/NTAB) family NADH-FMN oxidoreductase RutF